MPIDIVDASTFTDPIVAPAGADPANLDYIITIAQGLANRTRYLADRLGGGSGSGEWTYPSARTRTLIFDQPFFRLGTNADGTAQWALEDGGVNGPTCRPIGGAAIAKAAAFFRLPQGSTITAVRVLFAKHTDHVTASDRWQFRFEKLINWDFSPAAAPGRTIIGAQLDGGAGTGVAVVAWTGLTEVVANPSTTYYVAIEGPAVEGADDRLYGVEVTFSDPGPRNH